MEGVKLYQQFRNLINGNTAIKLAWFTSFNFSISFFEKYVLSALVKTNSVDIKNIKDFEAINDRILNNEYGGMDVKVFHDFRASRPDVKKTSIQTYAINPKDLDSKFNNGVFHPKVGLIVNEKNEGWLITGSANLTISGWSVNSEAVSVLKIEDLENATTILDFFRNLLPQNNESDDGFKKLNEINSFWKKSLVKNNPKWKFISSFNKSGLLAHLNIEATKNLHVWSPYFSNDVPQIIDSHFTNVLDVKIIPDYTGSGSVRISDKVLPQMKANSKIKFLKDLHDYKVEDILVHAKVWLTQSKLAIGSWNFTSAGLNLTKSNNNVEAGVVYELTDSDYSNFLSSAKLAEVDSLVGESEQSLMEDRDQILDDWTMTCQIFANWDTYTYKLVLPESVNRTDLYFNLPGIDNRVSQFDLNLGNVNFHKGYKSVLKDRLFSVYDSSKEGKNLFMGVIVELNPSYRPAVGFESINDLLRAWTDKSPEQRSQYHNLNFNTDLETGEELSNQISQALRNDYSNAWFTMFLAFEQMNIRLTDSIGNKHELNLIGYRIPGSVAQVSEHLTKLKEHHATDNEGMSDSFIWFMINEGNLVIEKFNNYIEPIGAIKVATVENITLDIPNVPEEQLHTWLSFIKQECKYPNA